VMISNHLHLSLTDAYGTTNLIEENQDAQDAIRVGIVDAYHRALPLVRLPEEVEVLAGTIYQSIGRGNVCLNGHSLDKGNPRRLEARVNSSEYMFDPWVNLFVSLLGVYRGLHHIGYVKDIDKGYKMHNDHYHNQGFTFGEIGEIKTYDQALRHLLKDKIIAEWFSPIEQRALVAALSSNWDISAGRRSVAEVRSENESIPLGDGKRRRLNDMGKEPTKTLAAPFTDRR